MKKIFTLLKCSSLLALVGYSAIACVNHDYDFKNITDVNTDITVGGSEFALPIGSLDAITLGQFLDENDFLTVSNGKYEISKNGSLSLEIPRIRIASFDPSDPILGELTLDFSNIAPSPQLTPKGDKQNSPTPYVNIDVTADASLGDVELDIMVPGVSKEIVSVKSLQFTSACEIIFSFSLTGLPPAVRVAFNQYTIEMPYFMTFQDPVLQSTRKLVLDNEQFSASGQYTKSVKVVGLSFQNALIPSASGQINVNGALSMQGSIKASGENIDPSQLRRVTFAPSISIGQMTVGSVVAKVNPDLKVESMDFVLDDVPDFLKSETTKLDLSSVAFALNASNPIDIKIDFGVDITPYRDGDVIGSQVVSQTGMVIQAHPFGSSEATTLTNIWLSNTLASTPIGYTGYLNSKLPKLIETVPDWLEIQPTAAVDQTRFSTIDLTRAYYMDIDYRLVAPLSLGADFMISYTEVVEDVKSQISDYLGYTSSIEILTSVLNDIPLQFTLTAKALDSDGLPLNNVKIEMKAAEGSQPGVILSCDAQGHAVRSNVVFKISETAKGALTKMDKINLTFTGAASQIVAGQSLAPEQSLKVNMSAKIPGGITIKQ